ncbi:MAG: nucleotidyl transferase AbiEii/AbiGii toxin family protein [Candidatus Thorarchaeota archaeon]
MFPNTLDSQTWKILQKIDEMPLLKEFYLAGGSATALQLGHRISRDIDFFTAKSFSIHELLQKLSTIEKPQVRQEEPGTLTVIMGDIPMSFFEYKAKLLKSPISFKSVRIASLLDIALMKLVSIAQRGARRDFVDLYYILQNEKWLLKSLLTQIPEKYPQIDFPSYHFIRALGFFDDAERDPPLQMLDEEYRWEKIVSFFKEESKSLIKNL